jgi:predicted O-methyltransferase YrrM
MDDRIKKVLDEYHVRIDRERRARREDRNALPRDESLLALGRDAGKLVNILARSLGKPRILELGTSYGYSGVWLADAARASGGHLTTMELQDYKSKYAREKSIEAGLSDYVDFQVGDAVQLIALLPFKLDFVLVDLWKDLYVPCLEEFYPKLNPGAIIVADNILHPGGEGVARYVEAVRKKEKMSSILVPVGSGLEISRFEGG